MTDATNNTDTIAVSELGELLTRMRDWPADAQRDALSATVVSALLHEAADTIQRLERESAELRHDLLRQMNIANAECNEAQKLREYLGKPFDGGSDSHGS